MNNKVGIYCKLINKMMNEYEKNGIEIPERRPLVENTSVTTLCDMINVFSDNSTSEYNSDNDIEYTKSDALLHSIMYVDGFLVCDVEHYKGWGKYNLETTAECGGGETTKYLYMSFVGYDCNLDNPPKRIDNVILPDEQEKLKEIIEEAKMLKMERTAQIRREFEEKFDREWKELVAELKL